MGSVSRRHASTVSALLCPTKATAPREPIKSVRCAGDSCSSHGIAEQHGLKASQIHNAKGGGTQYNGREAEGGGQTQEKDIRREVGGDR